MIFRDRGSFLSVQAEVAPLLVGFSGGQIQLIDPVRKELSRYSDMWKRCWTVYRVLSGYTTRRGWWTRVG